ncbi:Hypothetical protein Minf_0577 [Methylacidiphilum infernorum V4]|uniref:Uncharacterized protein n=1 Tax=Methylacidiphilum infernorum (isolate V4) TaxID=481448 RepID=B3DZX4_METI4|nr:Hypothetical protein Minf_0577 [Methylacidiphilum infernorum V4]
MTRSVLLKDEKGSAIPFLRDKIQLKYFIKCSEYIHILLLRNIKK